MTKAHEWLAIKALVLVRSHHICEGCGRALPDDVHHRQPRGMGGVFGHAAHVANSASNLLALCRPCHDFTEDQPTEARRRGWLVPHWTDSWSAPVDITPIYGRGWYYLLDDLSYRFAPDAEVRAFLRRVDTEVV